jgi:hypothetical protein
VADTKRQAGVQPIEAQASLSAFLSGCFGFVSARTHFRNRRNQSVVKKKGPEINPRLIDGDSWLFVDGKLRIARTTNLNEDGSITVDLYRNLSDYRLGWVME